MTTDLKNDSKVQLIQPEDQQKLFSNINTLYNKNKNMMSSNNSNLEDFNLKNSFFEKNFQLPPKNLSQIYDLINNFKKDDTDFYKHKLKTSPFDFLTNHGIQMSKIEKNEIDVKRLIDTSESIKPITVVEKYALKNNFEFFSNNTTQSFKRNFSSTIYSFEKEDSESMFLKQKIKQNLADFLSVIAPEKVVPSTKSLSGLNLVDNKENQDYKNKGVLFQSEDKMT